MDTAINHKEMRMDNGNDFLFDDFFDICVPVLRRTINADGQQFAGVYIYIAVYQFAVLYVRSQSDSTTLLPGLLTITNYSTGSYVWGKKPKKVSIYAYLCRHFHSVIYLWRIGMLMDAPRGIFFLVF